jgi:hypothetical protein
MTNTILNWTHIGVNIVDIRKLNKLYVIYTNIIEQNETVIQGDKWLGPLFIKDSIFEERLKSYFLKDISKITRDEILGAKWNFYITKGFFIKVNEAGEIEKFPHDENKWYVSYLEIAGPLGNFYSVYRDKELNKQ